jgi:hypothetical protein
MRAALTIAVFSALAVAAWGQPTSRDLLALQGRLADADGRPVEGAFPFRFRLYDGDGALLYSETQITVNVRAGFYAALLGSGAIDTEGTRWNTLAEVFANEPDVWLGVTVADDGEMTPRIRIGAAPFAFDAASLRGLAPALSGPDVLVRTDSSGLIDPSVIPPGVSGGPVLNDITPAVAVQGAPVDFTITGGVFLAPLEGIAIGGQACANVAFDSVTQVRGTSPAGLTPGVWDVSVTIRGGASATLAAAFLVAEFPPPDVTAITPIWGDIASEIPVTISGSAFRDPPVAFLGGITLASVLLLDAASITAVVPSGVLSATTYDLTVANPDGQSDTLANAYSGTAGGPPPGYTRAGTSEYWYRFMSCGEYSATICDGEPGMVPTVPMGDAMLAGGFRGSSIPCPNEAWWVTDPSCGGSQNRMYRDGSYEICYDNGYSLTGRVCVWPRR